MKTLKLISILFLLPISNVQAYESYFIEQINDTSIYELFNLRSKLDRIPVFQLCSSNNIFSENIKWCFNRKINVEIKSVDLVNLFQDGNLREGYRRTYKSEFVITLSKNGETIDIKLLHHQLKSVSEYQLYEILNDIEWKPALKNLMPVNSKFVLKIIYDEKIRLDELWHAKKLSFLQYHKNRVEQLTSIYLEEEHTYDFDLMEQLRSFENKQKLDSIFIHLENWTDTQIEELSNTYYSKRSGINNSNTHTISELLYRWTKRFENSYEEELMKALKKNG